MLDCREHHRDVLSWGDQHDAAEAFELLSDGVITQLQQWVAGSLAPGLLMPSLAHLQALSQLPACMGELSRASHMMLPCFTDLLLVRHLILHLSGNSTLDVQESRQLSCHRLRACLVPGGSWCRCLWSACCGMTQYVSAAARRPAAS
jgi:hypothetical protein